MTLSPDSQCDKRKTEEAQRKLLRQLLNHDIQGSLSAQIGINDILLEAGSSLHEEKRLEMIRLMASSCKKVLHDFRVLQILFSVSYLTEKKEKVDLREVFESVVAEHRQSLNDSRKSVDGARLCGTVLANEKWIRFLVDSMLQNALRHGGREIILCARTLPSGMCELACLDNGPSLERAVEELLFTPLHDQAKRDAGGIGLGTAMIRLISESLAGKYGFRRRDGKNCFYVRIPETG